MRAVVDRGLRLHGQQWLARIVRHARGQGVDAFWTLVDHKNQLVAGALDWLRSRGFQAILCPPYALPAPQHTKAFDLLPAASFAFLFNLLGLPAGVVSTTRVRRGEDAVRPDSRDTVERQAQATDRGSVGLPISVQVAALPWREDIVLALMAAIEAATRENDDYPCRVDVPSTGDRAPPKPRPSNP
jgi:fatty acid amide hydrolase